MGSVAANVAAIVEKARTSWLKNNEVLDLLEGYVAAGLSVCQEPPVRPEGGCCVPAGRAGCSVGHERPHVSQLASS